MPSNALVQSAWNKSSPHGVAVCLLENWVEERASAEIASGDVVSDTPAAIAAAKRNRVIPPSAHDNPATHYESTVQHVYQPPRKGTRDEQAIQQKSYSPRKNQYPMPSAMKGTRRAQMEAALWEQAKRDTAPVLKEQSAKDWMSSYHENYHKDFVSFDDFLFADEELLRALNVPVTIWQEHRKNQALYVSSMRRDVQDGTKSEQSQATAAQDASGFGKNADFSTPTEIYLKAASKDI